MPYLYVNKLIMLCERMSHDKSFLQKISLSTTWSNFVFTRGALAKKWGKLLSDRRFL